MVSYNFLFMPEFFFSKTLSLKSYAMLILDFNISGIVNVNISYQATQQYFTFSRKSISPSKYFLHSGDELSISIPFFTA